MSAVPPSQSKSQRTRSTTARVHRMRLARGACWVIVGALAVGAALSVLDAVMRLPEWGRGLSLAVWITGVGVMVWWLVARRVPADPETTSAHAKSELSVNLRAAAAAAVATAAALTAAALVPGAVDHVRRVAMPWTRAAGPLLYRVKVTSGEPVVRRGDSVTLSAYAEKLDPSAATPETATLVCRDRAGSETSHPMSGDGRGAFHATRSPVEAHFQYRVEIGGASSDWLQVAALDPVVPTPETTIEVTPPRYAPASARILVPGFRHFGGTQYAAAELRFCFNRAAATAFLEWRADGTTLVELVPITLGPERQSGIAAFRLRQDGVLKLVTVSEEGPQSLRSEFSIRVRVEPDRAPRFERVEGVSPHARTARPGTRIPIAITAADDVALGSADLEYIVGRGDSPPVVVPIPLVGAGTVHAEGRLELDLARLGRAGDQVRFRVRIADTRRLDDPDLKPQEAVFPERGWSRVSIQDGAPPLEEQDVRLEGQALHSALAAAHAEIRQSITDIERVRREGVEKAELTIDQTTLLTNACDRIGKDTIDPLHEAARLAGFTPEMRPLATALRQFVAEYLVSAEDSIRRAAAAHAKERNGSLMTASRQLEGAGRQLGQLIEANGRVQQARLDRTAISALAVEQFALANLARPGGVTPPEELARLQRDLFARLRKQVAGSEPLRLAAGRARQAEFTRVLESVRELMRDIRALSDASARLEAGTRLALFRAIAKDQGQIVALATVLDSQSATAARLAGVELPKPEQFVRIADLIAAGKTVEALTAIEERVQHLDTVAAAMKGWVESCRDPRVEARLLAAWQHDLRQRFITATAGKAARFPMLPDAVRAAFHREQHAIHLAFQAMPPPPSEELQKLRSELLDQLSSAADQLARSGTMVDLTLRQAGEALQRLSERYPTIPERQQKARAELQRIQQAQDSLLAQVEQVLRGSEPTRGLAALVDQQVKQNRAAAQLDVPGAGVRMPRVARALSAAARDLRDGSAADVLASQQWARRELDRLKQFVDDVRPIDDRAAEFAGKLAEIAADAGKADVPPGSKHLEALAARCRELARQIVLLGIPPEATALGNEALSAVLALDVAARDALTRPDEFRRRLAIASEMTRQFADRLNGSESELDRVRRLAAHRHAAVKAAQLNQGKPIKPDAAADTVRQLVREADELAHTRVGTAAQSRKLKALDQYSRLKEQNYPEQKAALHAALAETLDELAELMADIPELSRAFESVLPTREVAEAHTYIPSRALLGSIRELARQQRAFRDRLTGVATELKRVRLPSRENPFATIVQQQRDLTDSIEGLARTLELDQEITAARHAQQAAIDSVRTADHLASGQVAAARIAAEQTAHSLRLLSSHGTYSWAMTAAQLATRQGAIREGMSASLESPGAVATQLHARGVELAQQAAALTERLKLASKSADDAAASLLAAGGDLSQAGTQLAEGTRADAAGAHDEAARHRAQAMDLIRAATEQIAQHEETRPAPAESDQAATRSAGHLRHAELAIRQALDDLDRPDRAKVEQVMRVAAEALKAAALVRTEQKSR